MKNTLKWVIQISSICILLTIMLDGITGVDAIVGVAANNEIAKSYRDNGMFFSRIQPAIIKEKDVYISDLRNKFNHLWYITLGDSDLDNYW